MIMTYLEAIADAMRVEMRRDESVIMIGEDIGTYGGAFKLTKGFLDEFGSNRIIDAPISETAIIGAAIGASLNGMRPIAEMQFMDFITNGFNQLVTVAGTTAYRWSLPVPMVVRGPSGGGVGANPFHSRNSEAWFVHATGLKVVCPAFPDDAKGLMMASIRDNDPVVFFEHKGLYRKIKGEVPEGEYIVPLGKARTVRPGTHCSVIAYGSAVHMALEAADILAAEGIDVEIVDIRTLVPFDEENG
jgi:2-oxoisovalerate dehydrogenase E1 component beta subunit